MMKIDNIPLPEKIAETIRNYVMTGLLKPGDRLVEPKLSEMLGISRTPIREAFRILEMEGLITLIPRKGAVVTEISDKDIDEIFVIKIKLESLAAELSTPNLTSADIKRLRELNERMQNREGGSKQVTSLVNANTEFHRILTNACHNDRLVRMLDSLQQQFRRATSYSFSETGRITQVIKEHEAIIEALEKKDMAAVEAATALHIKNGWEFIKTRVNA